MLIFHKSLFYSLPALTQESDGMLLPRSCSNGKIYMDFLNSFFSLLIYAIKFLPNPKLNFFIPCMRTSKLISTVFFYTSIAIIISSLDFSYCKDISCPDIEKQALTSFKEGLKDPLNFLSSWDSEVDCCRWKGVVCNNLTGHVYELHFRSDDETSSGLSGHVYDKASSGISGKMNPSLLNLKHLRHLDLSGADFEGTIPSFIGSFKGLEYLNLSNAGFEGTIPHTIGNLSSLHVLSLIEFGLDVDSLEWLSGLSQLKHLDMSYVNLSIASNWLEVINTLPSLVELYLSTCRLNSIGNLNYANFSSLTILDLSWNSIRSFSVPRWVFELNNLVYLDIRNNPFKGPIPRFSNTTKLQYLDMSLNNFNSTIPDWLYNCINLNHMDLSYNNLHGVVSNAIANLTSLNTLSLSSNELSGEIPVETTTLCRLRVLYLYENLFLGDVNLSLGNMSDCFLGSLEILAINGNRLSGYLSNQFAKFRNLKSLDLKSNSISGVIPFDIGNVSSLEDLNLSDNKLTGNLPESIGHLYNLEYLDIEVNMLEGVVTETNFLNLTNLSYLYASGNHLTLQVNKNWNPPSKLATLRMSSWNLGGTIPSWIKKLKFLGVIDLSSTMISGNVPSWLWDISIINLSKNELCGKIPDFTDFDVAPYNIYLSSNKFNGPLPRVTDTVGELDLSNNMFSGGISHFLCDLTDKTYVMKILNLGGNQLTGEIPDCLDQWPSLTVLNLGNNNMLGNIPSSIRHLDKLVSLTLTNNELSGIIPISMKNCTSLVKIDLSDNYFDGPIPEWIGTRLLDLIVLILRSNEFGGTISSSICRLTSLQILDFSRNKILGVIPKCISNFTAMVNERDLTRYRGSRMFLYDIYSYVAGTFVDSAFISTKGSELEYGKLLPYVTNIDLSHNNLSGAIPKELTSLAVLRSLSLSQNRLNGSIPEEIGNMKQLESLDLSENSLSGEIPDSFMILTSLDYLNLSYNNLSGAIPQSTQILTMNASSFIGNKLCGLPLTRSCTGGDGVPTSPASEDEAEDDEDDDNWFGVFLSSGFVVGLFTFCAVLIINEQWREAYFEALENIWIKAWVCVSIRMKKLRE